MDRKLDICDVKSLNRIRPAGSVSRYLSPEESHVLQLLLVVLHGALQL